MTPTDAKLDATLRSWEDTPWVKGACVRGRGVDCVYFVCGVFDELYGVTAPLPPRMPIDTAANNPAGSRAMLRALMERYPSQSFDAAKEPYQAGDVVIVRPPRSHVRTLQHLNIVGPGNRIWHAGLGGVCYTSMRQWPITHAFRTLEKDRWLEKDSCAQEQTFPKNESRNGLPPPWKRI